MLIESASCSRAVICRLQFFAHFAVLISLSGLLQGSWSFILFLWNCVILGANSVKYNINAPKCCSLHALNIPITPFPPPPPSPLCNTSENQSINQHCIFLLKISGAVFSLISFFESCSQGKWFLLSLSEHRSCHVISPPMRTYCRALVRDKRHRAIYHLSHMGNWNKSIMISWRHTVKMKYNKVYMEET